MGVCWRGGGTPDTLETANIGPGATSSHPANTHPAVPGLVSNIPHSPPRIKDAPGADHLAAPVADAGLAGEVGALVVAERQQQVRGVAQRAAAHLRNTASLSNT